MSVIPHKKVSELTPYEKNARTHSKDQIKQIAASIAEFGFLNPILVDDENVIMAGHGRYEAAKLLGLDTVPVVPISNLTTKQKAAYVIADNNLALNAGWDQGMLMAELDDLEDFDLGILGFEDDNVIDIVDKMQPESIQTFKPTVEPTTNQKDITDDQVAKTDEALKDKFDFKESDDIELICPHCEEVYIIRKDSLL